MTPEQFVYWLQGCLEITDPKSLGEKEIQVIKDHIALVLKKETPNRTSITIVEDKTLPPDLMKIIQQPLPGTVYAPKRCSNTTLNCGDPNCLACTLKLTVTC